MAKGLGASSDLSQQLFHYVFADRNTSRLQCSLLKGGPSTTLCTDRYPLLPSHSQSVGLTEAGSEKQGALDLLLVPQSVSQATLTEHVLRANGSERKASQSFPFWSLSSSLSLSPAVTYVSIIPGFSWALKEP